MNWPDWPTTPERITQWLLVSGAIYLAARLAICGARKNAASHEWASSGDALMFGTSLILLIGAWNPATMRAIGDTSSFLLFSGFVGLQGTVRAAFHP